ncbi:MAG: hypothetical protein KDK44_05120 [Chlamydiia bacterium]|nr:hypothetical protein [Chlamydiia bacterium]
MKHPSIASVISFCSLDERFLPHAIEAVRPFSDQIIIALCDHRFDGTPENNQRYFDVVTGCTLVQYTYTPNRLYGTDSFIHPNTLHYRHHWHNTSRLVGHYFVDPQVEWVLFLDADEIIDTERFTEMAWEKDAYRLASYWYFREPSLQALTWHDSALLVRQKYVKPDILLHPKERSGMAKMLNAHTMALGSDQKPLVHHYSWVRTKAEMLKKASCWGHGPEDNWETLIEVEMAQPFSGTDFIYGYDYQTVTPFINPFEDKLWPAGQASIVHHVTPEYIYNLEVQRCFLTPTLT